MSAIELSGACTSSSLRPALSVADFHFTRGGLGPRCLYGGGESEGEGGERMRGKEKREI